MPIRATARTSSDPRPEAWTQRRMALLLLLAAFLIRAPQFGNPVIQVDEQFYLLVGDRMWHGALPYVDIWDRKPIGLFLIYAACRLLGGDGIVQYQIVATLCAGATAWLIARMARRLTSPAAAMLAGLTYIVFLSVNGGDGGQAPVFYNLLVALAANAVIRSFDARRAGRSDVAASCTAMALMGLAIQVKYSVVFEGMFFGLAMVVDSWRHGRRAGTIAVMSVAWIVLALLPTALVAGYYAYLGHWQAFAFANFQSIFLRPAVTGSELERRILRIAWRTAPVTLIAGLGCWRLIAKMAAEDCDIARLYVGWAIMAVLGLVVFGTYHDHYTLPILPPCCLAGAIAYAWRGTLRGTARPIGIWIGVLVLATGLTMATIIVRQNRLSRGDGRQAFAIAGYIKPRLNDCLFVFVFNGDPILYHLTASRLPTIWSFPTFLSEEREASSVGVDQLTELKRVMAARPHFVVSRNATPFPEKTPAVWAYIQPILQRDYRVVITAAVRGKVELLYERRIDKPAAIAY